MACAQDMGDYFRIPADGRDLNYEKFIDKGETELTRSSHSDEYNSNNTTRLSVDGMKNLLLKLGDLSRLNSEDLYSTEGH